MTHAFRRFLLLSLLSFLFVPAGFATVIHVPGDYAEIQAAIDAAQISDEVLVAPGTYTGPGNWDLSLGGKDIVVASEGGAAVTILDGNGHDGHGFVLYQTNETAAARIEGFTIRNFDLVEGDPYTPSGAGIFCYLASPTIRNCVIEDCDAYSTGGGIEVYASVPMEISGCVIRGCGSGAGETGDGGLGGGLKLTGPVTVSDCEIVGNHVYYGMFGGGNGAGIDCESGVSVLDCLISGNVVIELFDSPGSGGGIAARLGCSIVSCRVVGNVAGWGAGIAADTNVTIDDCLIAGNQAHKGGGLASGGGSVLVRGSTISSNRATLGTAPVTGGGVFVDESANVRLERTILWGNCSDDPGSEAFVQLGGALTFSCSDIASGGIEAEGTVSYEGENLFTDPLFCDPADCLSAPTTAGEYTLHLGSPCLPANNPCAVQIGVEGEGCGTVPVQQTTWGALKANFR